MHIEKRRAFIINFVFFLIIAVIALFILKYAVPLLSPFVIAAVIAVILHRPFRFLARKAHLPYKLVAILGVALVFGTIGTLLALSGIKLFASLAQFVGNLPNLYTNYLAQPLASALASLDELVNSLEFLRSDATLMAALDELSAQLMQTLGNLFSSISGAAMAFVSGLATGLPGLLVAVIFTIVASFFITADYDKLTGFCTDQLTEKGRGILRQIKTYVMGTLLVCIRSYIIILFITFVELSIGLSILRVRNALLVALCIAVLDILPVVGTGTAFWPWIVISLIQGRYGFAIGLAVLYVAITAIRNVIEPKIVGGQLGLHPVVTLASMFAGAKLFGILGLFGLPILLSLLCHLNDNGVIRLFKTGKEKPAPEPEPPADP